MTSHVRVGRHWRNARAGGLTTRTTGIDARDAWEIDRRLLEDGARPIIMWNAASSCWHPYVKGFKPMVNSLYNGSRFEDIWLDK